MSLDSFVATDCEELNELSTINGWETGYQQLGPGELSVRFDLALSPRLILSDKSCNRRMLHIARTPPDHKVVIVPFGSGDNGKLFGTEVSSGCIGLVNGSTDVYYQAPADMDMLVATVPMSLLVRTVLGSPLPSATDKAFFDTSIVEVGKSAVLDLAQKIQQLMSHIGSTTCPNAAQISLQELEEHLVSSLSHAVDHPRPARIENRGRINRRKYVGRALEFINAHLTEPLGVVTLAEEAGISLRSLESSFVENLGITPAGYIKTRRLNAVRSRLLRPRSKDSVALVAESYGFNHLSRFAGEYHSLFSEYPSGTLQRSMG